MLVVSQIAGLYRGRGTKTPELIRFPTETLSRQGPKGALSYFWTATISQPRQLIVKYEVTRSTPARLRRMKLDQTTSKLTLSRRCPSVEGWKEAVLIAQFLEVDHEAKFQESIHGLAKIL